MDRQRGIAPILIVVLIAVLVGGYFWFNYSNNRTEPVQYVQNTPAPTTKLESTSSAETANWKTYKGKYFSVLYPDNWYIWSFGRGIDLDYWQINSVPIDQQAAKNASYISFDTQKMTTTDYSNLEEYRNYLKKRQKEMPEYHLVFSDIIVNEQRAITNEETIDIYSPAYEKKVWLIQGEKKYIITWTIQAQTIQERDQLKNQYQPVFDQILSTFKFTQ